MATFNLTAPFQPPVGTVARVSATVDLTSNELVGTVELLTPGGVPAAQRQRRGPVPPALRTALINWLRGDDTLPPFSSENP